MDKTSKSSLPDRERGQRFSWAANKEGASQHVAALLVSPTRKVLLLYIPIKKFVKPLAVSKNLAVDIAPLDWYHHRFFV
ncbi:MAG: hypothetical protein QG665_92 [Patescibacteria group bacterium]|nr:hypothetical protein [Patescibacteria group bacterium]